MCESPVDSPRVCTWGPLGYQEAKGLSQQVRSMRGVCVAGLERGKARVGDGFPSLYLYLRLLTTLRPNHG